MSHTYIPIEVVVVVVVVVVVAAAEVEVEEKVFNLVINLTTVKQH